MQSPKLQPIEPSQPGSSSRQLPQNRGFFSKLSQRWQSTTDRQLAIASWVGLGIYLFGFGVAALLRTHQGDFEIYRDAGFRAAKGLPIYNFPAAPPFQYAPIYALFFIPFGLLPLRAARLLWFAISMAAALPALIVGTNRMLFGPRARLSAELIVLPTILISRFTHPNFVAGQISLMVFAMIVWGIALARESRPIGAGLLLAASLLVKPLALPGLLYLCSRRRLASVAWTVVFSILLLVMPLVGLRRTAGETRDYLASLYSRTDSSSRLRFDLKRPTVQSVSSVVYRWARASSGAYDLSPRTALVVGCGFDLVVLISLIGLASLVPRGPPIGEDLVLAGVFCITSSLLPVSWIDYYIALEVPYMALVAATSTRREPRPATRNMAIVALAGSLILNLASRLSNGLMFAGLPYLNTLFLLAAIVVLARARSRREESVELPDLATLARSRSRRDNRSSPVDA